MRFIYRLLTLMLTPLALLRLQRGEKQAGRWRERLGWIKRPRPGQIWIHAASVGEINAARALIAELLEREHSVLISTMTVTGAERCQELFGDTIEHRYLSLDNLLAVRRWLERAQPRIGLIMETEIWPELFARCRALNIPLLLVSARLSQRAMQHYQRFASLYATALESVSLASCQTQADADRLESLGLPKNRLQVSGNLKFDIAPPDLSASAESLKASWGGRPIWTAGSTRPGEETILIAAHQRLLSHHEDGLLILAPRHPRRASEVGKRLDQQGLRWCRFGQMPQAGVQIVLVDQLGILMTCYALAQVAFVGGSLVPLGGHNLLEPASLGLPVLTGPYLEQQAEAADRLEAAGGILRLEDAEALGQCLGHLFDNPAEARRMGLCAKAALEGGRGSLDRTLAAINPFLRVNGPVDRPSIATAD